MNKKNISPTNPQGVEYPEAVTATGTMVYAIKLDKNRGDCKGVRFFFLGCEGDDEEEMTFIQRKTKNGFTKFFRHKPGYIGDRDEPDRYLHNYAELRLKQRFDESADSGEFIVQYYVIEKCKSYHECKLKDEVKCNGDPKLTLKQLNLRDLYDTCTIEKGEDKYIADLLLTNSKDSSVKPMFLEIYVTHKCTDKKINSGYPIIEIKIKQKEDADNEIIENASSLVDEYLFMQSETIRKTAPIIFYGFDKEIPFTKYLYYGNFLLTKKDNHLVADCRTIACNEVSNFVPPNRVFSLSIPLYELKDVDLYELGMAKAQNLGFSVRDCSLCARYKIPTMQKDHIDARSCRLLNVTYSFKDKEGNNKHIQNPYVFCLPPRCDYFDKSMQAIGCRYYFIDNRRISSLVHNLDNIPILMWVDEDLLIKQTAKNIARIEDNKQKSFSDDNIGISHAETPYHKNGEKYEDVHENTKNIDCSKEVELLHNSNMVLLKECRHICPYNRWDCGYCLDSTEKDRRRYVICNSPLSPASKKEGTGTL